MWRKCLSKCSLSWDVTAPVLEGRREEHQAGMATWPGADFIFQTPMLNTLLLHPLNGFWRVVTVKIIAAFFCFSCELGHMSVAQGSETAWGTISSWFGSPIFSVIALMLTLVQKHEGVGWEGLEEEKTVTNRLLDCGFIALEQGLS